VLLSVGGSFHFSLSFHIDSVERTEIVTLKYIARLTKYMHAMLTYNQMCNVLANVQPQIHRRVLKAYLARLSTLFALNLLCESDGANGVRVCCCCAGGADIPF
jgi:hypothetical protein